MIYYGDTASRPLDTSRPCWHCHWFGGYTTRRGHTCACCLNPGCAFGVVWPAQGCSAWKREPGADDAPWHPDDVPIKQTVEQREAIEKQRRRLERLRERIIQGYAGHQVWPQVITVAGDVWWPSPGAITLAAALQERPP